MMYSCYEVQLTSFTFYSFYFGDLPYPAVLAG